MLGGKSYALKIQKEDGSFAYQVKCKGISLNRETEKIVTYEKMKELLDSSKTCRVEQDIFKRRNFERPLFKKSHRTLRRTASKRILLADFTTRPYGWKGPINVLEEFETGYHCDEDSDDEEEVL